MIVATPIRGESRRSATMTSLLVSAVLASLALCLCTAAGCRDRGSTAAEVEHGCDSQDGSVLVAALKAVANALPSGLPSTSTGTIVRAGEMGATAAFWQRHPEVRYGIALWSPGYSPDRRHALVAACVFPSAHGGLCLVLLRQIKGSWTVMSCQFKALDFQAVKARPHLPRLHVFGGAFWRGAGRPRVRMCLRLCTERHTRLAADGSNSGNRLCGPPCIRRWHATC